MVKVRRTFAFFRVIIFVFSRRWGQFFFPPLYHSLQATRCHAPRPGTVSLFWICFIPAFLPSSDGWKDEECDGLTVCVTLQDSGRAGKSCFLIWDCIYILILFSSYFLSSSSFPFFNDSGTVWEGDSLTVCHLDSGIAGGVMFLDLRLNIYFDFVKFSLFPSSDGWTDEECDGLTVSLPQDSGSAGESYFLTLDCLYMFYLVQFLHFLSTSPTMTRQSN